MNLLKIFIWSPNLEFILCNIWIKRFMMFSWTESELIQSRTEGRASLNYCVDKINKGIANLAYCTTQ